MARVLVLEPDKVLAQTYCRAFENAGYDVTYATSGQTAVDSADRLAPDVIILELQLPAHNGLEFLYEFRSYTDWQEIPIIVNTNILPSTYDSIGKDLCRRLGIKAWHYKPETTLQLLIRSVGDELLSH